jgi:fatty acid omega-hydroxylase
MTQITLFFWFASFGEELGLLSLEHDGQEKKTSSSKFFQGSIPFAAAFDHAQDHLDLRFSMIVGWQVIEKFVGSIGKPFKVACRVLDDCAYSLIDERIDQLTRASKSNDQEASSADLLSLFITALDERGSSLGRTELRDAAINLIVAGR